MIKKVTAFFLVTIILLSNCVMAADAIIRYSREGGNTLRDMATIIDDNTYVNADTQAYTNRVLNSDIKIYEYNTTTEKQCVDDNTIEYSGENKKNYFLTTSDYDFSNVFGDGQQDLFCTFRLPEGDINETNFATFEYKNGLVYNNEKYDIRINVKEINKVGNAKCKIRFLIGARDSSDQNELDVSTYNKKVEPTLGVEDLENTKVEIIVEYIILDKNGNEFPISGLFKVADLDQNQGLVISDFNAKHENTFIKDIFSGEGYEQIKYKYENENKDTFMYTAVQDPIADGDIYLLLENKSKINMTFTFDDVPAHSSLSFNKDIIKRYHKLITQVVGGNITPSINNIKDGETKKIEYSPADAEKKYLKTITVDGVAVSKETNPSHFTFSNINEDHEIIVVYGDKYKVTYDAKGGSPTPNTEYVIPNEKATNPGVTPTKRGYEFEGWNKKGETISYDYNNPVTADIDLEAVWTPAIYNIYYILNGGTNDPQNPSTYTIEDTINFQPATKEGYDFLGWYEDETFTTPIDSISNRTGDITVYAKWEAKKDTPYKVLHYKEDDDGNYELVVTDNLTGETNTTVTATPKNYTGYKENLTHVDRISTGTVAADGSLVLKLYYNKEKYKVTFEPKNDTTIDDQIVKYQDKATEPTKPLKNGYEFQYWYYLNENNEEVRYNFDDPVTHNIDLIGKWEKKEVKPSSNNTPKDNSKTDKTIPYTGGTNKIYIAIAITVCLTVYFGIRYKKIKM